MNLIEYKKLLEIPIQNLLKVVGVELKQIVHNKLLEHQTIEYKKNFFTKTLLHRSKPAKLLDFYQPLEIIIQSQEGFVETKKKYIQTLNISNLFQDSNYVTLIGKAGCGKSTLLKYLFINSVKTNFKIPIKVELRYLNEYKKGFNDYIIDEIFLFQKIGISTSIIEKILGSNSFVFFLDGYDELNLNIRERITKEIDHFTSKYQNNNFVITSRPYTNLDTLPLFTNYSICDLREEEIISFVKKQIPKYDSELTDKILETIKKVDNNSYKQFLSNPLLLSMFILTYQSYSEIPQKRSYFYGQVFETLYSMHDSISKLSFVRDKVSGLSKDNFIQILNSFSCLSFFDKKILFTQEYFDKTLNIIKSKKRDIAFDNNKLIEDLQISIGILYKEGQYYTFPHKSLQEYFCARYVSSLNESNKAVVFEKLKSSIEIGWKNYLVGNHHFLLLLAELDYNSVVKKLVIPLMKSEIAKIVGDQLDIQDKYLAVAKLFICIEDILIKSIREEKIHHELSKEEFLKTIWFYGTQGEYFRPTNKLESYFSNKLEEIINLINVKHEIWITSILAQIDEIEKGDTDLVQII
ncbi:NACHT domain-containing protein [Flavobacterium silvaticum]|uniref:NACHT domain-containing protein n=1 Tax=Flavobacterium silvaticum TaxID=1852020 RepID=A0A972JG70_9FLAO|nr:NACHT domain-containing protein [Flavobacterium silvaticum]NMH26550.1 hypothetical protein [Flavobacterium silvaticum]